MRRASVLLVALALTACSGETVLTPSPPPTTAATEVVASNPVTGTDGPGATTPTPEPEPALVPPAEQSGDAGDVQRQTSTTAPPSIRLGTTTTLPAASIARGPLPVNLGGTAVASWYGDELRGSPTASGTPFDPDQLTFAHKSMAFGTVVRFCGSIGCATGTCTDRGPFVGGRTFDLSEALFARVAPLSAGVATVDWEVVA